MRVCGEHRLFGVAEFVIKLPATARKPDSTFSEIVFRDIHFTKRETKRSSSKPWCSFPLAYVMVIWCELKKDKYTISDQDAEQVSPAKERGHGGTTMHVPFSRTVFDFLLDLFIWGI